MLLLPASIWPLADSIPWVRFHGGVLLSLPLIYLRISAGFSTSTKFRPTIMAGFLSGIAIGLLLFGAGMTVAWRKTKTARAETAVAKGFADHCQQERNLAQKELVRRLEQERELVKEKMQFESQLSEFEKFASLAQLALGAAHEINNPLLGILSHLELEAKDADEAKRLEIDECIEGARRIAAAVRGLLEYARVGHLTLGQVNLPRLVGDTLRFIENQPMFQKLKVQNCVPRDLPNISADANEVSQILMNLLLNAAQATSPGGTITIMAQKARCAEAIELLVRDTGCGISADVLPHVFEPFYTTKRGKGTGLGLSITQNYVHRGGGDIQIESIPGLGTVVKVTLPTQQSGQPVVSEEVIA